MFRELNLERHGLEWIEPPIQIAHPLDDGSAALLHRDIGATVASFGSAHDARVYEGWIRPLVESWNVIVDSLLGPIRPTRIASHPFAIARFGLPALASATMLARRFRSPAARALVAGTGAHSFLPLTQPLSGGLGQALLVSGHAVGWPIPRGGSQRIVDALAAVLLELGGEIETDHAVARPREHREPSRRHPRPGAARHPRRGRRAAGRRGTRHSCGATDMARPPSRLDLVLDGPIPWRNADVGRAATVHLGGRLEEVVASEDAVGRGRVHERPFVLLSQPSAFDASRATDGRHVVWAYCHVPNGWTGDATDRILAQVERFAPGFRDRILARHVTSPADLERYNPNYVGGDINGGLQHWAQFFTRPALRWDPYSTPDPRHLRRLGVDAAGRRRSRAVRAACGAIGAAWSAAIARD